MKRTTVKISDDLDRRLRQEAQRTGLTISEITRQALEGRLGTRRPILMSLAGSLKGPGYLSQRHEEILPLLIEAEFRESRS